MEKWLKPLVAKLRQVEVLARTSQWYTDNTIKELQAISPPSEGFLFVGKGTKKMIRLIGQRTELTSTLERTINEVVAEGEYNVSQT